MNDDMNMDDLDEAFGPENAISSSSNADDFSMDEGVDEVGPSPATDVEPPDLTSHDVSAEQRVTDYGSYPWGAGGSSGYRPASMAMTDRSMGEAESKPKMTMQQRRIQQASQGIDPMTVYDRDAQSWNYNGDTVGQGIFDMEESGMNLPGYGIFGNQYALPGYIAREPVMDVEQSEMWDIEAGDWRTVQPSAGGVPLSRRVDHFKAFSPFAKNTQQKAAPWTQLRPVPSGPQSHVEAYGRGAATILMNAAKRIPDVNNRSAFIENALVSLGPQTRQIANKAVQKLIQFGYPAEKALEDTVAHLIMNATAREMRGGSRLPHLDALAQRTGAWGRQIVQHANETIGPIVSDATQKKADLGRLMNSPAGQAMGRLGEDAPAPSSTSILTPKNVLIGGAVVAGGYLLWKKFAKKKG